MRASKKVKGAVLLSAGAALVLGAPSVHADSSADNNDNGLLGGLNLLNGLQLNVPVTVGGAGVLGVGDGEAIVSTGNTAGSGSTSGSGNTSGGGSSSASNNSGLISGLNVGNNLQANVPVTVCGVGALLARGEGDCNVKSGNTAGGGGGGASSSASGNSGLVTGVNALNNVQLSVPVTVCGLAVLGDANCEADVAPSNTAGGGSGSSAGAGSSSASGNSGLIGGLNLLNNLQASIPVTVCGLAVLGDADATCEVESTNNTGGDDDGEVEGVDRPDRDQGSSVRGATLPHTGAASLALIPFGLALVAGGVALRRRVGAES